MADEKVGVEVEASTEGAAAKLNAFAGTVRSATGQIEGNFKAMSGAVEAASSKLYTAFGLFAAGGIAAQAVQGTVRMTSEAMKLATQLGTTTNEASILAIALGDVYVSTDTYSGAVSMLNRQVRTNEEGLRKMGLEVRNTDGSYKSNAQIMKEALGVMASYREGTDRNLASQVLFGRGASETQGLLKLTGDVMDGAREKAERLGLVIGKDDVEATMAYKAAQNDLGDVLSAFQKTIGSALLPVLTSFITILTNAAEFVAPRLRDAFIGIGIVFNAFKTALIQTTAVVVGAFMTMVDLANRVGEAMHLALQGKFTEAGGAMKRFAEDTKQRWREVALVVKQSGEDFNAGTERAILGGGNKAPGRDQSIPQGSRTFKDPGKPKAEKSDMGAWKAELEAAKEAQGVMLKDTLAMEEAFWKRKLVLAKGNSKDTQAVQHELFAIHKQQAQQQYEADQSAMQFRLEMAKQDWGVRASILREEALLAKKTYGDRSTQHVEALRNIEREEQRHRDFLRGLEAEKVAQNAAAGMARIQSEKDVLSFQKEFGVISGQQYVQAVRQMQQMEYEIRREELGKRKALYAEDATEQLRISGELAALEAGHRREVQQSQMEMAREVRQTWTNAMSAITSTVSTSVQGMIMGTQTAQQAVRNIYANLLGSFIDMGVKMLANWIATQMGLTAVSTTQDAARAVSGVSTAGVVAAAEVDAAVTSISANAAKTGAGTWASISQIPLIGPFIAPAMAATAFAAAIAFTGKMRSARGGYDIPSGVNPAVQTHEEEMILPKDIANPLRDMVSGGGGMGGSVVIKALDSADVRRFLQRSGHRFADNLVKQARNMRFNGSTSLTGRI